MKQSTLIFLLAILLGWVNVQASAHDIAVANDDGVTIYYVFNSNKTELAVSCRGQYYYEFDNEYSGNVVIPSSVTYNGNVYPVTSLGIAPFSGCSSLTSITIPESVTSIGNSAFYDCSGLTSIAIPESVISIGNSAFYGCRGLTAITIPEGVTNIDGSAFQYCTSLTSITIPESVTRIGNSAFHSCSSLNSITIPKSITSIEGATFYKCSGLTSISIPNYYCPLNIHIAIPTLCNTGFWIFCYLRQAPSSVF